MASRCALPMEHNCSFPPSATLLPLLRSCDGAPRAWVEQMCWTMCNMESAGMYAPFLGCLHPKCTAAALLWKTALEEYNALCLLKQHKTPCIETNSWPDLSANSGRLSYLVVPARPRGKWQLCDTGFAFATKPSISVEQHLLFPPAVETLRHQGCSFREILHRTLFLFVPANELAPCPPDL